jgi:hypothetical protein
MARSEVVIVKPFFVIIGECECNSGTETVPIVEAFKAFASTADHTAEAATRARRIRYIVLTVSTS